MGSPSSRGRGLKLFRVMAVESKINSVALFTRAWIETANRDDNVSLKINSCRPLHRKSQDQFVSPSSRGRGLKQTGKSNRIETGLSPSSRGRGLKQYVGLAAGEFHAVALFTRAWIETMLASARREPSRVALFTRAWIETYSDYAVIRFF